MKVKVGEITKIKTGKLDANASSADGKYPFFTCSKDPLRINSYSYDCECVLVAGNGDLNVKHYNGKFDAYQRTYIIEDNSNGLLYMPYLYHFLEGYVGELRKQSIGGVIKYIKLGNLTDVLVELPSIEEQKYIVNLTNISLELIELRKKTIDKLDSLVKARFIEMFGSIHNSKTFVYYPLKEITTVCSGGTPNRDNKAYWEFGTIPWVKTNELKNNRLTHVEEFITELGLEESSAKLVPSDTVLVAMYGQGKTRGMTGYLEIEATTNQACACILPTNKMNMIYLWKYFELSYDKLRELAKGGNQPNLNCTMIKDFNILVPPIELQNQFANFVQQVDKSREAVKKSLEKTQQLYDSLMQEYFG